MSRVTENDDPSSDPSTKSLSSNTPSPSLPSLILSSALLTLSFPSSSLSRYEGKGDIDDIDDGEEGKRTEAREDNRTPSFHSDRLKPSTCKLGSMGRGQLRRNGERKTKKKDRREEKGTDPEGRSRRLTHERSACSPLLPFISCLPSS